MKLRVGMPWGKGCFKQKNCLWVQNLSDSVGGLRMSNLAHTIVWDRYWREYIPILYITIPITRHFLVPKGDWSRAEPCMETPFRSVNDHRSSDQACP